MMSYFFFAAINKSIVHGLNDQVTNECGTTRFAVVVSHNDVKGQWLKNGQSLEVCDTATYLRHRKTRSSLSPLLLQKMA